MRARGRGRAAPTGGRGRGRGGAHRGRGRPRSLLSLPRAQASWAPQLPAGLTGAPVPCLPSQGEAPAEMGALLLEKEPRGAAAERVHGPLGDTPHAEETLPKADPDSLEPAGPSSPASVTVTVGDEGADTPVGATPLIGDEPESLEGDGGRALLGHATKSFPSSPSKGGACPSRAKMSVTGAGKSPPSVQSLAMRLLSMPGAQGAATAGPEPPPAAATTTGQEGQPKVHRARKTMSKPGNGQPPVPEKRPPEVQHFRMSDDVHPLGKVTSDAAKRRKLNSGSLTEDFGSARGSGDMALEKGEPRPLEEWETVVGDDFSLYYDSYSVDERVDSDSKVCWRGWRPGFPVPSHSRSQIHSPEWSPPAHLCSCLSSVACPLW